MVFGEQDETDAPSFPLPEEAPAAERGYKAIKTLKRTTKRPIADLLALAVQNDPFYAGGQPAQRAQAAWFATLWETFGFTPGVHLRRIHYRLVSQEPPHGKMDGTPYENTEACWAYLGEASKTARELGLVAADAFEDHRNPLAETPVGSDRASEPPTLTWSPFVEPWRLPGIPTDLAGGIALAMPSPDLGGYDYTPEVQPYHLEIWAEKSTMNDVLEPLCRRYHAVLSTSLGFSSITRVVDFLHRLRQVNKPARIFFLSDFDPAGDQIPVAVARQIEYWIGEYAPGVDVKLTALCLTRDQVAHYALPRIPIKDSDRRKGHFEAHHGEGAVELDALEALHPGELATILDAALAPYFDQGLWWAYCERGAWAREEVEQAWGRATQDIREALQLQHDLAEEIVDRYRARLTALDAQLQADLAPIRERLEDLATALATVQAEFAPDLPEAPLPQVSPGDEADWLFDASRDYLDQLTHYKRRKGRKAKAKKRQEELPEADTPRSPQDAPSAD